MSDYLLRLACRIEAAANDANRMACAAMTISTLLALVIALAFGGTLPGEWWERLLSWVTVVALLAAALAVPAAAALWIALRIAAAALLAASFVAGPLIGLAGASRSGARHARP